MAIQLTEQDGRQSMQAHAASKGAEMSAKVGPEIGWGALQQILNDRTLVRYPCEILFDSNGLVPGECAHAQARSDEPNDGFTIYIHPFFVANPHDAVALALYQLVVVNYGPFASSDDAEALGAAALGISQDQYYARLCQIADQLP
jgi:hypothetical protein